MKGISFKAGFLLIFLFTLMPFLPMNSMAAEEKYPSRTIELCHGFGPGGALDTQNRLLADKLEKIFGVHVISVPKPGGGQVVLMNLLINAPPDGYMVANCSHTGIAQTFMQSKGTYSLDSIKTVCQITIFGDALCVPSDSPLKTFQELIDFAKKNPGVKFGHSGIGTNSYMRFQTLNKNINLGMVGVPFKSDAEVLAALLGKHVPVGIFSAMGAKIQSDAGKIRILFSASPPAKFGLDPSIPSMRTSFDKGIADQDIESVGFIVVPGKTPDEIVRVLENAFEIVAKDPEVAAGMQKFNTGLDFCDSKTATQNLSRAIEKIQTFYSK